MERIAYVSDDDGHTYVIPLALEEQFYGMLEQSLNYQDEDKRGIAEENFIKLFAPYMIGGHISLIKLYADFNDLRA